MKFSKPFAISLSFILLVCDGAPAGLRDPTFPSALKDERDLQVAPHTVDLSQSFAKGELYNSNTGAKAILELAEQERELTGLMILERGEIVTEYYRDDMDSSDLQQINSCTKSWIGLLFGVMEKNGLISLNETLGDVWPDDDTWKHVEDDDYRRLITIESLLTMSAGLKMRPGSLFFDLPGTGDKGWAGGAYLEHALEYHDIDEAQKGEYAYVEWINIFSYIVRERTGLTPEEYAVQQVFPHLGITDRDYKWDTNFAGDSYSGFGMHMTIEAMAKLGMLYLQDGMASESVNVVEKDWIDRSTHGGEGHPFYGYLWRIQVGGQLFCATGFGGQLICVDKYEDRVLALASENYLAGVGISPGEVLRSDQAVIDLVLALSFSEPIET